MCHVCPAVWVESLSHKRFCESLDKVGMHSCVRMWLRVLEISGLTSSHAERAFVETLGYCSPFEVQAIYNVPCLFVSSDSDFYHINYLFLFITCCGIITKFQVLYLADPSFHKIQVVHTSCIT